MIGCGWLLGNEHQERSTLPSKLIRNWYSLRRTGGLSDDLRMAECGSSLSVVLSTPRRNLKASGLNWAAYYRRPYTLVLGPHFPAIGGTPEYAP
jgi:hypothetical protein